MIEYRFGSIVAVGEEGLENFVDIMGSSFHDKLYTDH